MQMQPILGFTVVDVPWNDHFFMLVLFYAIPERLFPGPCVLGDGLTLICKKIQFWPSWILS